VITDLVSLVALHEGFRQKPYRDTVGKLTVGHGFNLDDTGIYEDESKMLLSMRLDKTYKELEKALPWVAQLDPVRKAVVVDMAYNLGLVGLLGFKNTLADIKAGDYVGASDRMLQSKWASQVKGRAVRLSTMMKTGEWPEK
jgi:lysozyme